MAEPRLTFSPEDAARVRDVEALVAGGTSAVPELLERLTDPSWAVRRSVIAGLAQLGDAAAAPLCELLRTRRDDERRLAAAVDALVASRGAVDEVVMALAAPDAAPALVCDAAQVLGRRKAAVAVPMLARLTRHADDNVAVAAVEALGRIGAGAGTEALIALCADPRFFRVFPAIAVLGESGDARAVPTLVGLLDAPLHAHAAAEALGRTGDVRAAPALTRLLASADDTLVRSAALACVGLHERRRERYGEVGELEAAIAAAATPRAVAALTHALPGASSGERRAIAQVLGCLGGDAAAAALLTLLADTPEIVEAATAALRRFGAALDARLRDELGRADSARRLVLLQLVGGRAGSQDAVIACLADADPGVRAAACDSLGRTGDTRAVPALFRTLEDADERVAQSAQGAIQSLGSHETERLTLVAARSPRPALRRAALRIIGYFGYASGLDVLLAGIHEPDQRLRDAAIAGLAFVEDPRAAAALTRARRDPSARTRAAAVRALGHRSPSEATRVELREAMDDDDAWVRYYACQALGRLRDPVAQPRLRAAIADPAGQVRVAAVEALAQLGDAAGLDALAGALRSQDADVRRAALVGLGQSRQPAALPAVLAGLRDADASTRLVAISALAALDVPEVVAELRRAGDDAHESVRAAAVELLAAREGADATVALAELLDRPELRARISSVLATPARGRVTGLHAALAHADDQRAPLLASVLARSANPEATASLIDTLRSGAVAARRAAAEALALVDGPAARAALEAASANDPAASVRRTAALALNG